MSGRSVTADIIKGAIAGAVAMKAMNSATQVMYDRQSKESLEREDEARGGEMAPAIMAGKGARLILRHELDEDTKQKAGKYLHQGIGIGSGIVYAVLRDRVTPISWGKGIVYGMLIFATVDEGLNTATGATPPPNQFPWQAHARGVLGHLVLGMTLDATLDLMDRVTPEALKA